MGKVIKVKGAYGESNFGDDLLMLVFERYFSENFDAELIFEGEDKSYPSKLLKEGKYNLQKSFDLLVYGGGTQFFSFRSESRLSKHEIFKLAFSNPIYFLNKIKSKLFKSTVYKTDEKADVRQAFLGIGLGPFSNNIAVINATSQKLKKADYVGVRDEISKKFCDELEIRSTLGADVVFSTYFKSFVDRIKNKSKETTIKNSKKIGIIVRDWDWDEAGRSYYDRLIKLISLRGDFDFEFIVFAPYKDKEWLKRLKNLPKLIWNPEEHSVEDFMLKLNNFDGFISARYHGAILASLLAKPVVCVEVEDKLRILTTQVKEMCLWEKPFDSGQLLDYLENFFDRKINYDDSIGELRNRADNMLIEFKNLNM